ncbi:hypothetical protein JCM9957A_08970 [Kineosporia succinea]
MTWPEPFEVAVFALIDRPSLVMWPWKSLNASSWAVTVFFAAFAAAVSMVDVVVVPAAPVTFAVVVASLGALVPAGVLMPAGVLALAGVLAWAPVTSQVGTPIRPASPRAMPTRVRVPHLPLPLAASSEAVIVCAPP